MSGFPYGFVEANECRACHGYAGKDELCDACTRAGETLLDLDPTCPLCKREHDVGEIFDGHGIDCASCGRFLVAVACGELGTMSMQPGDSGPHMPDTRTGRQRTRARWRRQGRRGG